VRDRGALIFRVYHRFYEIYSTNENASRKLLCWMKLSRLFPMVPIKARVIQEFQEQISLPMETTPAQRANGGPSRRTTAGTRFSRVVFTLPNWTQEELDHLKSLEVKWMIIGKETCPKTGTPHLQGAVILHNQLRHSSLKTFLGSRVHFQRMDGTPTDSERYCSKEDPNPFVKGTLPQQGKRNDLHAAVEKVKNGFSLRDLAADADMGSAVAVVKFSKGLTILRSALATPRSSPPSVFWLYGSTGTGKTRTAYEAAKSYSSHEKDVWISSGTLRWFDGYDAQPVAIFDDFRAKDVSFNFMLRLLDRYPVQVEFKGGFANWNPRIIFVTAPRSPTQLYSLLKERSPEDLRQLERRITASYDFDDDITWASWEAIAADISSRILDGLPPSSDSGSDLDPEPDGEPIPEL